MPWSNEDVSCLTLNNFTVQYSAYGCELHKLTLMDLLSDPEQGSLHPAQGYLLLLAVGCKASSAVWCHCGVGEGVLKAPDDVHHIVRHVDMGVYFNIIMQGLHLVVISSNRCMWVCTATSS